MKKDTLIKLITLGATAVILSGCSVFPDPVFGSSLSFNDYTSFSQEPIEYNDTEPDPEAPNKVESTYTYKDYTANNYYNLSSAPAIGSPKFLVIPVWFTDSTTYITTDKKDSVRSDIEKAYFGTESDTGWESVVTYYRKDSFGLCNIEGIVTDWYEPGKASTYYSTDDNVTKTKSIVKSAISWYKTTYSVSSLTDYDYDKDGYLDGVLLIYACPDYIAMDRESDDNLWAYCYWVQDTSLKSVSNPGVNAFFWASYDFMYGSNAKTRTGKSSYAGGDTSHCTIDAHTYIHEMGHIFGLEDYYDYTNKTQPAAGFSMQDCNVGGHDPYSRIALGWIRPYVPEETCTFTVYNTESTGDVILLSPSYTGSPFDEYILIELYAPIGLNEFDSVYHYLSKYPRGPQTYGVRIWHVDARLYSNKNGSLTTTPKAGYKVEHATSNTSAGSDYSIDLAGNTNYNLNQLIRQDYLTTTYKSNSDLSAGDLFKANQTFSASTYKRQFVNGTTVNGATLDSGASLGWSIRFDSMTSEKMTVTCTKL